MMNLSELWRHFRLLADQETLSKEQKEFILKFLTEEHHRKEQKRIQYLMNMSGIKRTKVLDDFDWKYNPKIPRDKILEYMNTQWLKKPSNLVLIGPAGVGKTHVATALCHDALSKGQQTVFLTLFDLTAKMAKAKSIYSFIEYHLGQPSGVWMRSAM